MMRVLPILPLLALGLAAPALAQGGGLSATLASPAAITRIVARETLWNCAGTECRAPRAGTSSDMTECRAVARRLGPVASFAVAGKNFDAAQVARCNAGQANQ